MKTALSFLALLLCLVQSALAAELTLEENMLLVQRGMDPVVERTVAATAPKRHTKQSYIQTQDNGKSSSLFESEGNVFMVGDITPVMDIKLIFSCLSRLGLKEDAYGVIFIKTGTGSWGRMLFTGLSAQFSTDMSKMPQFRCD